MSVFGKHKRNFLQILAQAFNLGIHNQWYIQEETIAGTFEKPGVSVLGYSKSDLNPSIDISAGGLNQLGINVDGLGRVNVTIDETVGTSGALIAAELETKINAALVAAGYDAQVLVSYNGTPATDYYLVQSLNAGATGSVVIDAGDADDVAASLLLGLANSGTEAAGTKGGSEICQNSGSITYQQPIEASPCRTGTRTPVNVIKKKKTLEWNVTSFFNPLGVSPWVCPPVALLFEALLGTKELSGSDLIFKPGVPSKYFSLVQVGSSHAQYANGLWVNQLVINLPGDAEATLEFSGGGQQTKLGGMAYVNADVLAPTTSLVVKSTNGGAKQFEAGSYLMVISGSDGKTIKSDRAGIEVLTSNTDTNTLTLGASVDDLLEDDLVVPWYPDSFEPNDDPQVGLEGGLTWNAEALEMLSGTVTINNNHEDRNNIFGTDRSKGFVASNMLSIIAEVQVRLSVAEIAKLRDVRDFVEIPLVFTLGQDTGKRLRVSMPKVRFPIPSIEIPEEGSVTVTFSEGRAYDSKPGAFDALELKIY